MLLLSPGESGYPLDMETTTAPHTWIPATVTVLVQPGNQRLVMPRPKTALQLLEALHLREETALVARNGELLTPDRRIFANDELLVRKVTSAG